MEGKRSRRRSYAKMERWRGWQSFKQSFLFPTKCILLKFTSRLRHKSKGSSHGLMSLYKDMESCGEYTDIQVMWEIIHSSSPPDAYKTTRSKERTSSRRFCFRPT